MLTKTVLTAVELTELLDAVFEYNRRGQVHGLSFFDATGKLVEVATVEATSGAAGLAVQTVPETQGPTLLDMLYPMERDARAS